MATIYTRTVPADITAGTKTVLRRHPFLCRSFVCCVLFLSEIGLFYALVVEQLRAGAGHGHIAGLEDVAPVGYLQRRVGVLLYEEDGHAVVIDAADFQHTMP